ncbi:MAG: sulfatase [Actinomycetota bacterium]
MSPRNVVLVLLDSLNRHDLGCYGAAHGASPNLDRFASQSVRFDRHVTGSMPCMPARHDLLVGALDFLWRPWGSIEVWEEPITHHLRAAGVTTALVSDHPHLFESGGENYHTDFHSWDYQRGSENDPWRLVPDATAVGAPSIPDARPAPFPRAYDVSRTWFREEADFPGPRTMASAADWVRVNAAAQDRYLLFVDEFDPHEPFDTPEPWASRFDEDWSDAKLIWPPYAVDALGQGRLDEASARQVRASYLGGLAMIDHWFGRLLDAIDASPDADDTAIIVCTDHGHYLGDLDDTGRDLWGKPMVPLYEEIAHTPLLIRWPGREPGVVDALTTNVDLHATLCDVFGVSMEHRVHGRSIAPLLDGTASSIRDWAVAGYWGNWVHVVDAAGRKYARSHVGDNAPLSMWSNRWSTMPLPIDHGHRMPRPDGRARLDHMPGSDVPVIRQPFEPGDPIPYWASMARPDEHHLFDLVEDPTEDRNLVGEDRRREAELSELLRVALRELEADEHLERLGLD